MIQIYGSPNSSAGRCFLMLEELNVPYEQIPLDMRNKEHKSEKFLKLNPNGKIPTIVDGDFVLWESLAINHYLCEKYRPELLGQTIEERARVQQWSTWALAELQPPLVQMLIQLFFVPEDKRDMKSVETNREKVPPMLKVLDTSMAGKNYVLGQKISLADFNLFSVVNIAHAFQIDLTAYPAVNEWFKRMKDRPSVRKFSEIRK